MAGCACAQQKWSVLIIPLDKVLKVLRDQGSKFVLNLWNILGVCRAPSGNLIVLETFGRIIVTSGTQTL